MKKISLLVLCIIIIAAARIEAQMSDTAKNFLFDSQVQLWQRMTISIGDVKVKDYKGKKYPYYNIIGSGVIAYIHVGDSTMPVIITAKHVVENKNHELLDTIRVRFSWDGDQDVYKNLGYRFVLKGKDARYVFTLPDSTVDLVCIPFIGLVDEFNHSNGITFLAYNRYAKQNDYFEGRDVYVLGYPASVGSTYWTRGLLRKGIISWLPDSGIEKKKFIIDCNVFPGNSGGPVFALYKPGDFFRPEELIANVNNAKFYGIVIERRLNYNDVYDSATNKRFKGNALISSESIGVGIVEPAMNVLKLLNYTEKLIAEQYKGTKK